MRCIHCGGDAGGWGRDGAGHRRYRCQRCRRTFAFRPPPPLGAMRLPFDKALVCLSLLLEGSSIRGAERVTGVHRDTLCNLLVTVGEGCGPLHRRLTAGFEPVNVESAEVHGILGMTEATKRRLGIESPHLGAVIARVEVEPASKLVVAWGLRPGGGPANGHGDGAHGGPHAARHAQVLSAQLRRLGPGTQAFSRKRKNLEAALALHAVHYNLCRIHSALHYTPAMAADLTPRLWNLEDLVHAAVATAAETEVAAPEPSPVPDPVTD